MKYRIGTRGSLLARTQAGGVAAALEALGHEAEMVVIRTSGDDSKTPFAQVGPQGVFVREIESALVGAEVDLAVHSYKDLPSESPADLVVAAVPERRTAADVLVARQGEIEIGSGLTGLPPGAVVGTASARRAAWLEKLVPGVRVKNLRGNVPTRIRRLRDGDFEAIVLAAAGLTRLAESDLDEGLDLQGLVVEKLDPERFVPAPTQGALAIQCRAEDRDLRELLAGLEDSKTRRTTEAERALLMRADAGCETAFGAHCVLHSERSFSLTAMIDDNGTVRRESLHGDDPLSLVDPVWWAITAGER